MNPTTRIVVPWHNPDQIAKWREAWGVPQELTPDWLILQWDQKREGCGVTKNKGVEAALFCGGDIVIVLDDDCYPVDGMTLQGFAEAHEAALEPQPVRLFAAVTEPPSRGTPYSEFRARMPVAASMGFWRGIGDYCSARQLVHGADHAMTFKRETIFGQFFALCGMNLAFRPKQWLPWCRFIDVPRFDDIWAGWLWQKEAYRLDHCFNLHGPDVLHSRQSNVWKNLEAEAKYLERSETLWRDIATSPATDYETLRKLLPA